MVPRKSDAESYVNGVMAPNHGVAGGGKGGAGCQTPGPLPQV